MGFLQKVEIAAAVVESQREHKSYRAKVEAKYKIIEKIKQLASSLLKKALPALLMFSAGTAMAKIKNPEAMGKTFEKIAEQTLPDYKDVSVKTTVVDNGEDAPQAVIYTLNAKGVEKQDGTVMIKYVEGKKAVVKFTRGDWTSAVGTVAEEFRQTLDDVAKSVVVKNKVTKNTGHQQQTQHKDTKLAGK